MPSFRRDDAFQAIPLEADARLQPVLDRLTARAGAINCEVCASSAGLRPCTGSLTTDPQVVAAAGHCIEPLKTAFDKTAALAACIYHRAAKLEGVGAELVTEAANPSPLNGMKLAITGQVFWADSSSVRLSKLHLGVAAAALDRHSLELLPYIMAHELFCHVYQFALGSPREGEPDQCCAFAEGGMDFVAAWVVRGGPLGTAVTPWPSAAVAERALSTHMQRRTPPFATARLVAQGARSAENILKWFEIHQREAKLPRDAWEDFVDLSCQLNASPAWTQRLRGTTLATLPRRLGVDGSEVDAALIDALIKWRCERNKNPSAFSALLGALTRRHI